MTRQQMNDKTAEETLKEIFATLENTDDEMEGRFPADEFGAAEKPGHGEEFGELAEFAGYSDLYEPDSDHALETVPEEDPGEIGINWSALFWLVLSLASAGILFYTQLSDTAQSANRSTLAATTSALDTQITDIGYQSLLAVNGKPESFAAVDKLTEQIDTSITLLTVDHASSQADPAADSVRDKWQLLARAWNNIKPDIAVLLNNPGAIEKTVSNVAMINRLTPQLLVKTDQVVERLIDDQASLELINMASRQRFLSQRIKAGANEFVSSGPGWEDVATQFAQDVKSFGRSNIAISRQGGSVVESTAREVGNLHTELTGIADDLMNNVGDYFSMRNAADNVIAASNTINHLLKNLQAGFTSGSESIAAGRLPMVLGGAAVLSLFGLFWSIFSHSKKQAAVNARRTQLSEDAVIKLLDEMGDLAQGDLTVEAEVTDEITGAIADSINFAVSEMRELVTGIKSAAGEMNETAQSTESLIAQLLLSSDAQSQEIESAAAEVRDMNEGINRMNHSAVQTTRQARISAQVAQNGAAAVRNTVHGMNTARNQIQETAKQLKRLGESSQQINEIVDLIQDVTEQTNVLSLNASIQAAMAGEAGRGFAVVAEEVQRLAERSGRASSEITELVKNIQKDANNAITSMEATTQEVVSGATTADEAGRALSEIETMSQDLLKTINQVGEEAQHESKVAETVASRMKALQSSTSESDLSVSQVAVALEQMKSVTERLNQSIAGFTLPQES